MTETSIITRLGAPLVVAGALTACSFLSNPAPVVAVVQGDVTKVASAVEGACAVADTAAAAAAPFSSVPAISSILSFEKSGCGDAAAVAALVAKDVADPTTVTWVENLASQLNAAVTAVKAL